MRPTFFRFLCGSFTFLVGIVCFNSWLLFTKLSAEEPNFSLTLEAKSVHESYRPQGVDQTYEMSDGSWIRSSCENFASSEESMDELQRRVEQVPEFLYREPVFEADGRKIGERVITKTPHLVALWTHNNVLCKAEAASLSHLNWRLVR
jgi:hypothetical protein